MASTTEADDTRTDPEYTDERLREIGRDLRDFIESDHRLSLLCKHTYIQQLDNPLTTDCPRITLFMDGEAGSGSTKATIIARVIESDVPVTVESTCEGHGHIEFEPTE